MKNVLIIESQMKQYRIFFYDRLYESLRKQNIRLKVAYSDPCAEQRRKGDNGDLPEGYGRKVKGYWYWKERLLYQPLLREISSADLVVSDEANKLVLNHYLLLLSRLRMKRVAFWGHGQNRQGNKSAFSERYRQRTLNWVTWWFAYTAGTADYLRRRGVPGSKITVVQNSIDTRRLQDCVRRFGADHKAALRAKLEILPQASVGIFVGALHNVKSLSFLLESSQQIRKSIPDFHLVIVGCGPEEEQIKNSAVQHSWIHLVGPMFGEAKAKFLAIADVFLLPGAVGLAILDSFAAGLPLITTTLPTHGPEVEYLDDGYNGIMTPHTPEAYADTVIRLLSQPEELGTLSEGARRSAEKYSIEAMVENFADGILQCLQQPKWKWAKPSLPATEKTSVASRISAIVQDAKAKREPVNGNGALLADLAASFASPNEEPARKAFLTTSWDDGHPLDFRIAELLTKYGLPATFYVPRASQRAVMSPHQVRELSRSFEIGAHTLDHLRIDRWTDAEASSRLSASRKWIEEIAGKKCEVFCFPGGKFKSRQLRLVCEAGFQAARTVELLSLAEPRSVGGLHLIPTTIQAFPHRRYGYLKNAAKRVPSIRLGSLAAAMYHRDWVALAKELFFQTLQSRGVFHLWGHSWEIEQENQWHQLEELLRAISMCHLEFKSATNAELCRHAA